jgi:hypothetical protein
MTGVGLMRMLLHPAKAFRLQICGPVLLARYKEGPQRILLKIGADPIYHGMSQGLLVSGINKLPFLAGVGDIAA